MISSGTFAGGLTACLVFNLFNFQAKQMCLPNVLRLWDWYFSCKDGIEMHEWVCLAVLEGLAGLFEDMEGGEIGVCLERLPALDIDQVIGCALNWKDVEKA